MIRIETVRPQLHAKNNPAPSAFQQIQAEERADTFELRRQATHPARFQGKHPQTASTGGTDSQTLSPKKPPVIQKLFGQPRKNMMWTLGYSVGGVMLLPIPPVATGAFCLALVHLVSATYQFLNQKPEPQISPAHSSSN
jgi:hypothetical protein